MMPHTPFLLSLLAGAMFAAGGVCAAEPSAANSTGEGGEAAPDGGGVTGTVVLRDGRRVAGVIAIEEGSLAVRSPDGATVDVTLEEVDRLQLDPSGTGLPADDAESLLAGALPAPWRSKDLGRLAVPGRARWQDHRFVLAASARAEDENFDAMHLAYRPMSGDGEIVARVVAIEDGDADEGSFGGIIFCDGLTPENRKAMLAVHFGERGRVNFRRWGYQGGSTTGADDPVIKAPFWLKLVREGFDVKAYYSPDGVRWRFLKEDVGKMRDEEIFVGLVAGGGDRGQLRGVVIDNISINGEGSKPAEPMLPHLVLRTGSRLAADLVKADATAFHFRGRWEDVAVTTPQVARVEFFHPLPENLARQVQGERTGLLLRSGDFAEGDFHSLGEGTITVGSVLFGRSGFSVLDDVDALILRKVAAPAEVPRFQVATHAGSILMASGAKLVGDRLLVTVPELGEVSFALEETASLRCHPVQ